jgi:hypothetical protein
MAVVHHAVQAHTRHAVAHLERRRKYKGKRKYSVRILMYEGSRKEELEYDK